MRILLFVEFLKRGPETEWTKNCGDFHTRGLDREPEFAGVLEIIKRDAGNGRRKEKKRKEKKRGKEERKYRQSVNDIVFRS